MVVGIAVPLTHCETVSESEPESETEADQESVVVLDAGFEGEPIRVCEIVRVTVRVMLGEELCDGEREIERV